MKNNFEAARQPGKNLYEQVCEKIRDEIISGQYEAGDRIPSKRSLAESLQCSLNTVQTAYAQLVDEGYLRVREKSGFFVADLEGILTGGLQSTAVVLPEEKVSPYLYDFSYQGIDETSFPLTLWRRLSREAMSGVFLSSSDANGSYELRSSIAKYLRLSRGVQCSPSQVLISSGSEYLLQLLIQLLDSDTIYAIENPGYEKLSQLFRSNRVTYRPIDVDGQGVILKQLISSDADVVCITPSHQFPTGSIMPVGRRLQLLSWAQQSDRRYIIEDDYDSEFRYAGKPIPSLQGLDQSGRVIYLGSFSKSLFPSLRVSYLVLPEHLCHRYDELLSFYMCPVPLQIQKTLARFLSGGHFDRHLNRMRKIYKGKREVLVTFLRESFPESTIEGAPAGGHLVIRMKSGKSEDELVQAAEKAGVKVYGLSLFYSRQTKVQEGPSILLGYASLSIGQIEEGVALLRRAWK